jgi:hypothetical protein
MSARRHLPKDRATLRRAVRAEIDRVVACFRGGRDGAARLVRSEGLLVNGTPILFAADVTLRSSAVMRLLNIM